MKQILKLLSLSLLLTSTANAEIRIETVDGNFTAIRSITTNTQSYANFDSSCEDVHNVYWLHQPFAVNIKIDSETEMPLPIINVNIKGIEVPVYLKEMLRSGKFVFRSEQLPANFEHTNVNFIELNIEQGKFDNVWHNRFTRVVFKPHDKGLTYLCSATSIR